MALLENGHISNQEKQCTCKIILWRVHETTFAVKINKYYTLLCVCVCVERGWVSGWVWMHELEHVLAYLSSMPSADAISSAFSLAPTDFSTLSCKWHYFQKKLLNINVRFDFLYSTYLKHFSFYEEFNVMLSQAWKRLHIK